MRIRRHYCMRDKFGLVKFLNRFQIMYETAGMENELYSFDLYEDQDVYKKFKERFPFISRFDSFNTIEYSKEEIEKAEWLFIRSQSIKVQWEYDEKAYKQLCPYKPLFQKELCYRHSEQTHILSVTKAVKWGTRQFFSGPNAADDIIFCSERAKSILENRWNGLEFWPVKKCNSSKNVADLYQLFFAKCLPIDALSGGKMAVCKGCGRKILRVSDGTNQLAINRKYLQDQRNVYNTGEVLTGYIIGSNTFSLNIVPQDFYQYCERHGMNRGMIYESVNLV